MVLYELVQGIMFHSWYVPCPLLLQHYILVSHLAILLSQNHKHHIQEQLDAETTRLMSATRRQSCAAADAEAWQAWQPS